MESSTFLPVLYVERRSMIQGGLAMKREAVVLKKCTGLSGKSLFIGAIKNACSPPAGCVTAVVCRRKTWGSLRCVFVDVCR